MLDYAYLHRVTIVICTIVGSSLILGCGLGADQTSVPDHVVEEESVPSDENADSSEPVDGPRPAPDFEISDRDVLRLLFHDEDGTLRNAPDDVKYVDYFDPKIVRLQVVERLTTAGGDATIDLDHPYFAHAFIVWAPDGESTWIDLHLRNGLVVGDDPVVISSGYGELASYDTGARGDGGDGDGGRRVVEVKSKKQAFSEQRQPFLSGPAEARNVVLLRPHDGARVDHDQPLLVQGYARTFEANVVLRLVTDEPWYETYTTATSWTDAWGWFEMHVDASELPDEGFTVEVGEHSAKDGTWQGVSVDVTRE